MYKRFIVAVLSILTILIPAVSFSSCRSNSDIPVEKEGFYMGTVITERVYGQNAEKASEEVMLRMKQIEERMTINAAGGDVNKLNSEAGRSTVKLNEDTIYVLNKARQYGELSSGTFDVTIGPLVQSWGIFTDHKRVLSKNEVDSLLKLVNYRDLTVDSGNLTAKLARQGQVVDLGGIAKGFAGDEAIKIYKKYGVVSAFVNLGGNVVTLGKKPDGSPWSIGVQNPRAANGKYIGILKISDKAVVSSGDYERFFEENGIRYHHIIDPRSGYPSDSGLIGTTIVADSSIDADALSTSTFVLGLDKGMELIESLQGVEAIFITKDKKVYITSGLKDIFIFDDETGEFEYVDEKR